VHPNPVVADVVHDVLGDTPGAHLFEPFEYPEWANLMNRASFIITDSGGLQEEAPSLGKPVLLLRDTTERPEALEAGTVRMVGTGQQAVFDWVQKLLRDPNEYVTMSQAANPYGDGKASERILAALKFYFQLQPERPDDFSG
jgi:UDP-N-acetylglucosamine 2-epimerase (non-hydrolysing)